LFLTSQIVLRGGKSHPIENEELLLRQLLCNYLWFGLTPLVVWLTRQFPFAKKVWRNSLFFHILMSIIISIVHILLLTIVTQISSLEVLGATFSMRFVEHFRLNIHSNIFLYWIIVGITSLINTHRRQSEENLRTSQLETKLAQVQLQSLKSQLHPHFLFNTLNTISILMEKDVKTANQMLVSLSDLLRVTLDEIGTQQVPLRQEIDFLEQYLKIEQMRFEERLCVKMKIEPAVLDVKVPNLILQPLVENAVRHGISPQISGGTIEIEAKRQNGNLCLIVSDDGAGNDSQNLPKGIGLSNTQARLEKLYPSNHTFQIKRVNGFSVEITLPFQMT
jgi:sensor histidine kinase YesM